MGTRIVISQGDITEAEVEAIVNAANTDLMLGAGVAGAIRRKGGPEIAMQCAEHGPVKLGEAARTGAGTLKARYVIHAASMHLGGVTSAASLRNAVRNSLARAEEKKLKTLAFPAIGTGVAGSPMKQCSEIMLEEILRHIRGETSLEEIHFVLFDERGLQKFQKTYSELAGKR